MKVIFLLLIFFFIVQPHLFRCLPVHGRKTGGGRAAAERRGELGCQTDVITEFVPSDSRVYSCLQRRTRRLLRRRRGRVAAQTRSAEGFLAREKRPRAVFKPTPEGSTALVNALQTAQILLLSSLILFFLTPFGFYSIFPIFILQWKNIYR